MHDTTILLQATDPDPVQLTNPRGPAPFLLVCDHAGRLIPHALGDLGVAAPDLQRHIAWDIGAGAVGKLLAEKLDATLISQTYSRLVIDCNRDPAVPSSIPILAESVEIPGNLDLDAAAIDARRAEIFEPYHARVRTLLDERAAAGRRTILVAQHSMTNIFNGVRREMHAAVLYNRDRRFAGKVLDGLRREVGLIIGDNEPYFVSDDTDYTIPHHGEARGLLHVEIEIRQDLITHEAGQDEWARRLSRILAHAELEIALLQRN